MTARTAARTSISRCTARCAGCSVLLLLLVALTFAQNADQAGQYGASLNRTTPNAMSERSRGETVLQVSVYEENGKTHLDRQSVLKVTNQGAHTVNWYATDDNSVASLEPPYGMYEVEASAVGYLSEQKEIQISAPGAVLMQFSLRRDPTAASLEVNDVALPVKARKEAKHAVSDLKSGNLKDARKQLDAAYQLAPANPDLNYLLGYLFYQEKNLSQAQSYLQTASTGSHNLQALTLLGRVELTEEQYPAAAATLGKAVEADPDYWFAHNLLADAYLKEKKFEDARHEAELAIARGKIPASPANLTLGEALVNLGKREEGIRALKAFVQDSPKNPAVPQVRDLIAKLDSLPPDSVGYAKSDPETLGKNTAAPLPGVDPLLASPEMPVFVRSWQPPGIDEIKPPVAAGAVCPLETVLQKSGERMQELINDVSQTAVIEHLLHEQLDDMGNPATKETRDYNTVTSISENQPGYLAVDESRSERNTRADYPDDIYSGGFSALAFVFHPVMRENFDMTCEGLGDWHGQAAWLVHFKQRDDRPARIHNYKVAGNVYSLRLKGRAWITADKFQIVRVESELINPIPEIRLRSEHLVVDYGPVQFPKKHMELWLPNSAEVYLDFRKRLYFRRHSFDHYMLFSVDAEEKTNPPKAPPTQPAEKPVAN